MWHIFLYQVLKDWTIISGNNWHADLHRRPRMREKVPNASMTGDQEDLVIVR